MQQVVSIKSAKANVQLVVVSWMTWKATLVDHRSNSASSCRICELLQVETDEQCRQARSVALDACIALLISASTSLSVLVVPAAAPWPTTSSSATGGPQV